jgi:predicted permease
MMAPLRRLAGRILAFVTPRHAEQDLAREIAAHLALLEDDFVRRGLTREEARVAARRALGGVDQTKERHRDARSFIWLEDLRRDVPYALRGLRRAPGFTAAAVVTLALGIGATTAVVSVVNTILLAPLPYADADRLVQLIEQIPARQPGRPASRRGLGRNELLEWQARTETLVGMAMAYGTPQAIMPTPQGTARLSGAMVSRHYFSLLGTSSYLGRTLQPEDETDNQDVVVLAFATWQRYFRSDPQVLGTTVTLRANNVFDGRLFTIVGVMPADFVDPMLSTNDFWTSLVVRNPEQARAMSNTQGAVLGLLKPGVSIAVALEEANAIGNAITPRPSLSGEGVTGLRRFEVQSVKERVVGSVRPALQVFLAAVVVVLLIVCANIANLLLARGTARQREVAMRLAVGAGRGRIVRQMLTESLVLAAIGGALGAIVGAAGIAVIKALATVNAPGIFQLSFGGHILPRLIELHVDPGVLTLALTFSAITSLIFGYIPALRLSRVDHLHVLGARTATGSGDDRLRSVLVVGQLMMATVLLVGAGLLTHSFVKLSTVHTGYDPANVLAFQLVLPQEYSTTRKVETIDALLARLRQLPGVRAAGFSYAGALVGVVNVVGYVVPPGRSLEEMQQEPNRPQVRSVSGDYLGAIGVRLLGGRALDERDDANAPIVVLVNQSVARQYFGDASPVGAIMTWHGRDVSPIQVEIVGVVDDVRQGRLDQEPAPEIFVDYRQMLALQQRWGASTMAQEALALGFMSFAVRGIGDPAGLAPTVASTIASLDPNAGIDAIAPMDRLVASSIARPRFYAILLGIFAAIAAVLGAIGIYGVLAYAVVQRTQEIGVRMALGAQRSEVLRLVLRRGALLTTIGIVLGIAGAAGLARYLSGMLYGLTPLDPATYAAVAVGFALVALFASYLPARRATKVDPMVALRCE